MKTFTLILFTALIIITSIFCGGCTKQRVGELFGVGAKVYTRDYDALYPPSVQPLTVLGYGSADDPGNWEHYYECVTTTGVKVGFWASQITLDKSKAETKPNGRFWWLTAKGDTTYINPNTIK